MKGYSSCTKIDLHTFIQMNVYLWTNDTMDGLLDVNRLDNLLCCSWNCFMVMLSCSSRLWCSYLNLSRGYFFTSSAHLEPGTDSWNSQHLLNSNCIQFWITRCVKTTILLQVCHHRFISTSSVLHRFDSTQKYHLLSWRWKTI